ncbi:MULTISPECIES: alpha/beta fold hydrolase [Mycolicibacterium]|uniref:Alpha/beta hydrolase fold protein n=1 Tax=Mycolicibacterium gilvum TaxID=1804 RepID=A0A378SKH6_9MYCO|nr:MULTISPECIES: alpha/beta hydrolase [Mycolicibacterium]MBV5245477.1 alpha/beta hydrolase [Mycolicibacterium sp. PAM1]MCV7055050.1 alpha/beta hydrolase [Mycolicibacterium gilvum]STZ42364.1 alpha/beta hydrolase fold protein [Mycolicibacterium gilvum]
MTEQLCTYRFGPAGPARVLAIHGLTGHGKRWESLFTRHLSDIPAVAPDLVGHGRSSWDAPWTIEANVAALTALLDAEAEGPVVGPVVVVGHSFGGAIALNLAAARPDLIAGLVLLDPAVGLDGRWMREIADEMYTSPDYTDREEARQEKIGGSWGEVAEDELDRELDEHLVASAGGRVGWRISIPAMLCYWSELTRPAVIPRDGTPTTLVRATRTDPPYAGDELVAALDAGLGPNFTLLEWDCDHMVPLARPAETARLIRDLLP